MLSGFRAGQRAEAQLVNLGVCLSDDSELCNIVEKMSLVFAIADLGSQEYDVIFTCVSYAEARNRYRLDVCPSVRLSVCPSVRPSVRLSHTGIVSKRLNILSCFLRHTIAHSF